MIESAGGVIWRASREGDYEVLIVHRRRRKDWSLPKGRRRRRESALECAMREVREETGFRCIAEQELPEVRYIDHRGRDRWIRYWMMQAVRGEFQPNSEVDQIRWTPIELVGDLLTQEHELDVVSGLRLVRADIA